MQEGSMAPTATALQLTSEAFGFAAGIFLIGCFLFEVPSNDALNKYRSRPMPDTRNAIAVTGHGFSAPAASHEG
jgi:hypothetical protein